VEPRAKAANRKLTFVFEYSSHPGQPSASRSNENFHAGASLLEWAAWVPPAFSGKRQNICQWPRGMRRTWQIAGIRISWSKMIDVAMGARIAKTVRQLDHERL
jgi:hypothetical protein